MRALLLTGGPGHPAASSEAAMTAVLGPHDRYVDIDAGLDALDPTVHDLLAVNALAFEMQHERYDDVRAEQAFSLDERGRRRIEAWVGAGRPVFGLHTAVVCFDDWPMWGRILGGAWVWDESYHDPVGPVRVCFGGDRFEVVDECYSRLRLVPGNRVVATVEGTPVAWTRTHGGAPVACCVLGHDSRSLDEPACRALLRHLVDEVRR